MCVWVWSHGHGAHGPGRGGAGRDVRGNGRVEWRGYIFASVYMRTKETRPREISEAEEIDTREIQRCVECGSGDEPNTRTGTGHVQ